MIPIYSTTVLYDILYWKVPILLKIFIITLISYHLKNSWHRQTLVGTQRVDIYYRGEHSLYRSLIILTHLLNVIVGLSFFTKHHYDDTVMLSLMEIITTTCLTGSPDTEHQYFLCDFILLLVLAVPPLWVGDQQSYLKNKLNGK